MLNTNDNFENDKLMKEIEQLDDNPAIDSIEEHEKKKRPENLFFMIIIVIIAICGVYVYMTSNGSSVPTLVPVADENTEENSSEKTIETEVDVVDEEYTYSSGYGDDEEQYNLNVFLKQKENLIISQLGLNVEKKLMISIANKNREHMDDLELYAVFYDGENNVVDINNSRIDLIKSGAIRYMLVENSKTDYERVEIFITKKYFWNSSEFIFVDEQLKYAVNEEDGELKFKLKNESDKTIDMADFTIIYYDKNDKIINIGEIREYDIKKNKTAEATDYILWDYNYSREEPPFERYDVIMNYAMNYGF